MTIQGTIDMMRAMKRELSPINRLSLASCMLALVALSGCPALEKKTNCPPGTYRCFQGRPQYCSPQQRWTPISEPCANASTVCCWTQNPISGRQLYACVPQSACLEDPNPVQDADASVEQ